jgi:tetratricopeptide (TPR) repeat protein
MGHLHNRDAWSVLPDEVVTALESWVRYEPCVLDHQEWFTSGRSGAPVASVIRSIDDDPHLLVLKFCEFDAGQRMLNLRSGWRESPGFHAHLAEPEDRPIPLTDGWSAVFMQVAAEDLEHMKALTDLHQYEGFSDYCAKIVRSVLLDWTENKVVRAERKVSVLLTDMMGRRRPAAEKWARRVGIAIDEPQVRRNDWPMPLPNPFAFVNGSEGGRKVPNLLLGKAHGDLNGRNVRVPAEPDVVPEDYVLIDYDRYSKSEPLARDPMLLLVALVLDRIDTFSSVPSDLAKVIVHPHTKDVGLLEPFRRLSAAIHTASEVLAGTRGLKPDWRRQCLLSLIGVSLAHLGRELPVRDQDAAKEWFFHIAALAAEKYLQSAPPRKSIDVPKTTASPAMRSRRTSPELVDREDELPVLRRRLTSGPGGVVMVRGQRGIGKTALVDAVLDQLRNADAAIRIHRHTVDAISRLDAGVLIDYIAGEHDPAISHTGVSSLAGLEAALQRLGDSRVVIVLDSAENLIDTETNNTATNNLDPDLDNALELLAAGHDHRVVVLLVTHQDIASATDATWPNAELPIPVGKLPPEHFFAYLASLDRTGRMVSADQIPQRLYESLQGNPRLAELAHAVVFFAQTGLADLPSLTEKLLRQQAKDVPAHLARVLFDGLTAVQQHVLQALALFDTPVPMSAVTYMCDGDPPGTAQQALTALAAYRIVRHVDDEYSVLPEDRSLILSGIDEDELRRLYRKAARRLLSLRNREPRGVNDLRVHFAELQALLRLDAPGEIFEMIRDINDVLREWNYSERLRKPREQIRGRLGDYEEMVNENALGGIYVALSEFDLANKAYDKAIKIAHARRDDVNKMRAYVNLATMYWQHNDTALALGYYELAHDEALRLGRFDVMMGALEGKADCHRRHGLYGQAIGYAENALAVPKLTDYPDSDEAQRVATTRSVAVALKLARWYGEQGRADDAQRLIDVADSAAEGKLNNWLQASCLDGRADMLYDRGDYELAVSTAQQAVDRGLRLRDGVTVLQARTTLCLSHLRMDRPREAYGEIETAHRYRKKWRSLIVLALYGLAARWKDDTNKAELRFKQLYDQAADRIERDGDDFAAWDFKGLAVCGLHMDSRKPDLKEAKEAFEFARTVASRTPVLVDRLRFMLMQLDEYGSWTGRLRSVIDLLSEHCDRAT